MSETLAHTHLVRIIIDWLSANYPPVPGFCLFCDCPTVVATEKPASIDGFYPDVYVLTTPPILTVIGEAKTLPDLESTRSFNQFLAFLRFLAVRPAPRLVVAVPWQAVATAKNLIKTAQRETDAGHVIATFLVA
jgi:hypothetical protein